MGVVVVVVEVVVVVKGYRLRRFLFLFFVLFSPAACLQFHHVHFSIRLI